MATTAQVSFTGNDAPHPEVQQEVLQDIAGHLPPDWTIELHCHRWGRYRCWVIKATGRGKAELVGFPKQFTFDIHLGRTTWHVLLWVTS